MFQLVCHFGIEDYLHGWIIQLHSLKLITAHNYFIFRLKISFVNWKLRGDSKFSFKNIFVNEDCHHSVHRQVYWSKECHVLLDKSGVGTNETSADCLSLNKSPSQRPSTHPSPCNCSHSIHHCFILLSQISQARG